MGDQTGALLGVLEPLRLTWPGLACLRRGLTLGRSEDLPASREMQEAVRDGVPQISQPGKTSVWGAEDGRREASFAPGGHPGPRARSAVPRTQRGASSLARDEKCGHGAINTRSREKMDRQKSLAVTKCPRG